MADRIDRIRLETSGDIEHEPCRQTLEQQGAQMRSIRIIATTALAVAALAACSTSSTPQDKSAQAVGGPVVAATTQSPAPTATTASPTSLPSGPVGANDVDPCQLVTQQEASALTGASFGPGEEEKDSGNAKRCVYGAQTKNVFEVITAEAATAAEAQQYKNAILAQAQQELGSVVNLHAVSGIGDAAEQISGSLHGLVNVAGIYVLKGTFGFALVDLVTGHAAPGESAMQTQAQTVVGRLP
jgi:hypothetical protein